MEETCKEHSGCDARITHLEESVSSHEERLRSVEVMVYKASGITGFVMGLVVIVVQHYWK